MRIATKLAGAMVAILLICSPILCAYAKEKITNFHTNIKVQADGTILVVETIDVIAERRKIKRGIYRDFPLTFKDKNGEVNKVSFNLISTERNGKPDKHRLSYKNNFVRIYMGDKDVFLNPGSYQYTISYSTDRQIRFFDDHDELYWNVTGNFWSFPIKHASASIELPKGANISEVVTFTGPLGSKENNATSSTSAEPNRASVATTAPLSKREGLTFAARFQKGIVTVPDNAAMVWFLNDNLFPITGFLGGILLLCYYVLFWLEIGRDPPSDAIVPRWDIPAGISPALANYIDKKGISSNPAKAFAAAIVNMGVNGLLILKNETNELGFLEQLSNQPKTSLRTISTGKQPEAPLPTGEKVLFSFLASRIKGEQRELKFITENKKTIIKMKDNFRDALSKEHRNQYYKHNLLVVLGGISLSILLLIIMILLDRQLFLSAIETIMPVLFIVFFLSTFLASQQLFNFSSHNLIFQWIVIITLLVVPLVWSGVENSFTGRDLTAFFAVAVIVSIIAINVQFYFLMGAPTRLGKIASEHLEGLRTYLQLAEADRMNMDKVPQMSPQHFQTLLPYAIALGVEKPWAESFKSWLATSAAANSNSVNFWYERNGSLDSVSALGNISDSISASIDAAIPSSSSSGFTGGFSGGGGGGGGGGGW